MQYIFGFPLIPKHVTFNDLEWLFYVKFCFHDCRSRTFCVTFACSLGTLVHRNTRFMRIFAGFSGKEVLNDSGVVR